MNFSSLTIIQQNYIDNSTCSGLATVIQGPLCGQALCCTVIVNSTEITMHTRSYDAEPYWENLQLHY